MKYNKTTVISILTNVYKFGIIGNRGALTKKDLSLYIDYMIDDIKVLSENVQITRTGIDYLNSNTTDVIRGL